MPRIRQLPSSVIAQIAAGEVIERPASVVKELLENSIDAGATRVDIDLDAGGTELIRVADDGCGIDPDDLALAFAQHATSKLETADDLFRIGTMGFRGEALSSIAGVGQVTLQSRTHDAASGCEVRCDGGALTPAKPWNGSPGTRIEVKHLFFNVPVRKKFHKSVGTELGHVCEIVTRLALANPALHLTLRHNGRLVYDVPASAGLLDRIALFFTGEVRDALYDLDSGPGPVRLTGFLADPACDRGNARLQYLFVNGRWVRDRTVAHALKEAYRGLLLTGRQPIGFLFLTVPPDHVDVNVHPTKSEVRFRESAQVYSLVRSMVKGRLLRENLVPRLRGPSEDGDWEPGPGGRTDERLGLFSPRRDSAERSVAPLEVPERWQAGVDRRLGVPSPDLPPPVRPAFPEALGVPDPLAHGGLPAATPAHGGTPDLDPPPVATNVPAGSPGTPTAVQFHDAYLVLESGDGMVVIDQHALHERILFEQLRRRRRDGTPDVQRLLVPEPIDLSAAHAALVLDAADALRELGLDVTDFGGHTLLLSSYPTVLGCRPLGEIFRGVVEYLVAQDRPPTRDALLHDLTAVVACKAAVQAGDRLTAEEIAYLVHLRPMAEGSPHCPHGRPTSLVFSRHDLDKQFRRT